MASKHLLSKSTFMYGCQCPKRLYLHKFKPELRNPEDEQQESIFAAGTDVGLLARGLFPNGVSAEPPDAFSYPIAVEKTAKYIAQQHAVIYEAAFNFEGVMCAMDILVKKRNKWYAFEVKGTTKVKEPHVMDASLQHYVISNSGLRLEDISIVYVNNQYVRKGKLDIQKLFTSASVLKQVTGNKDFVEQKISELKRLLAEKKQPAIDVGEHCYKPYPCDFTNHCRANVAEESPAGEKYMDKKSIREFLDEWEYPFYYFDFETVMPAVPEYDYSRPYQQIPFQYSLHIQKSKKSETEHFEFLGDGINDPREELIKDLLNKLGKKGSIIVWNKSFEIKCLKELEIKQQFSHISTPEDNSYIEAFFSNLRRDMLSKTEFYSYYKAKIKIEEYMNFYNCKRRHRSIGKITPQEKWMEGLKIKSKTKSKTNYLYTKNQIKNQPPVETVFEIMSN